MAEDDGGIGIVTLMAAVMSAIKILRELVNPTSGDKTMVATIPTDMELYVLIAAVAFAVVFSVAAFIWRYAEHNAKHELMVKDNKIFGKAGFKFVGAEIFAIALAAVVAYYGAALAPGRFGLVDPALFDYILAAGIVALVAGIVFTILFNEGMTGLSKFIKQKAKEAAEAATDIAEAAESVKLTKKQLKKLKEMEEMQALMAKFTKAEEKVEEKVEEAPAEEAPLEDQA